MVIREQLAHARNFSEAIHGAALLYNFMLAEKSAGKELMKQYRDELTSWAESLLARENEFTRWDRKQFWSIARSDPSIRISPLTQDFVDKWLDLALAPAIASRVKSSTSKLPGFLNLQLSTCNLQLSQIPLGCGFPLSICGRTAPLSNPNSATIMKTFMIQKTVSLLLLGALCMATPDALAHLPKPTRSSGVVPTLDLDSQTLVFKPAKGKKPLLLDWSKETAFNGNGQSVPASELKVGTTVEIYYKDVSFHNPLLKKVVWTDTGK